MAHLKTLLKLASIHVLIDTLQCKNKKVSTKKSKRTPYRSVHK